MTRQASAIVPSRRRRRAAILPLSLVLIGCQGDPPRRTDMAAVFDTAPSPPIPPRDPGRLVPMTPADIRRSAMTCLQPPPYPSRQPARYVLELNAGQAAKLGLKDGATLRFSPDIPTPE